MSIKKIAVLASVVLLVLVVGREFLDGQVSVEIQFRLEDARGPIEADLWRNRESVAFYRDAGNSRTPAPWKLRAPSGDYRMSLRYHNADGSLNQSERRIALGEHSPLTVPLASN